MNGLVGQHHGIDLSRARNGLRIGDPDRRHRVEHPGTGAGHEHPLAGLGTPHPDRLGRGRAAVFIGTAIGLVRVRLAWRRIALGLLGPTRSRGRGPVNPSGLHRELSPARRRSTPAVLAVGIACPRPALAHQHAHRGHHDSGRDHEPGAHVPSVTVCLDTFHVERDSTKVARTPSYSGGVTGGTGLPVAA